MNKLINFVKEFTKKNIPELADVEKIGRQYFSIGPEVRKLKSTIPAIPFSAGLFFGELQGNKFKPGFPLLDILAKYTDRKIIASKKGETMFLFHNSILEESIAKYGSDNLSSGLVLVENEAGEVLGYGEVKLDREGKKIIKNILDRSDFLKRETTRQQNKKNKSFK
jgi:ribosome biogenesis protein Nip4